MKSGNTFAVFQPFARTIFFSTEIKNSAAADSRNGWPVHRGDSTLFVKLQKECAFVVIADYIYIMHDRVYKKIQTGGELLVWYGEDYAAELGISDAPDEDKQQQQLISGMF